MTDGSASGIEWLDQLREGVIVIDAGVVAALNRAAAQMLDVDQAEAVGRRAISILRDHRLEDLALTAAVGEGRELDVRGRRLQVTRTSRGLLLTDLSELRRVQLETRELLAVLSHELRTPVTAVRSALEALRSGDVPRDLRQRFLDGALAEAERLSRLLSDLTVDVKPPRARSVDLTRALRRAAALTAHLASARDVDVVVETEPAEAEPFDVWVDEDKLVQAAVNLIENAAVHGPRGELVTVVAFRRDKTAAFEVRDRGAPLGLDVIESLFEVRSLPSAKAKGTGLGLYIVRSLARDWGGTSWGRPLEGEGGGNAFGVEIPLAGHR